MGWLCPKLSLIPNPPPRAAFRGLKVGVRVHIEGKDVPWRLDSPGPQADCQCLKSKLLSGDLLLHDWQASGSQHERKAHGSADVGNSRATTCAQFADQLPGERGRHK